MPRGVKLGTVRGEYSRTDFSVASSDKAYKLRAVIGSKEVRHHDGVYYFSIRSSRYTDVVARLTERGYDVKPVC